jgi:hypothetical protein
MIKKINPRIHMVEEGAEERTKGIERQNYNRLNSQI